MTRKKFFITIVSVCIILVAAEIAVVLGLFRKENKKNTEKPTETEFAATEQPSPTETVKPTNTPEPAKVLKTFDDFIPTPTPEAWVNRIELYPGDRRIEGTEEGYYDVWRPTEQRFYTMNEMFFWIEPRTYMDEPFMWSKEVDRNSLEGARMESTLAGLISYQYDPRGNLLLLKENPCYIYQWDTREYRISYDALFSPYVTIDYNGYSSPYPMLNHRYAYDTEGRIIHEWLEEQEQYSGCYSEYGYPEYVYYYGEDGRLALREGYTKDGELAESLWMNYTFDEQGRISFYSESNEKRSLHKEFFYDDNGILTEVKEYHREKNLDRDITKRYNENGELIGIAIDCLLLNNFTESGFTITNSYEFTSETGPDGQRISRFTLDGEDGNPDYYVRTYEYDDVGNVTERATYSPDGLLLYREEITYEQFNVPVSKLTEAERIKLKLYH